MQYHRWCSQGNIDTIPKKTENNVTIVKQMIIPTVWENMRQPSSSPPGSSSRCPFCSRLALPCSFLWYVGRCRNSIHDNKTKRNDVHPLQNKQVRLKEHAYTHTQTRRYWTKYRRYLVQLLTYLAQKDFSGGFITSPRPLSASINWSSNDGVLQAQKFVRIRKLLWDCSSRERTPFVTISSGFSAFRS